MLITADRNKIQRLKICFNIKWLVNADYGQFLAKVDRQLWTELSH